MNNGVGRTRIDHSNKMETGRVMMLIGDAEKCWV